MTTPPCEVIGILALGCGANCGLCGAGALSRDKILEILPLSAELSGFPFALEYLSSILFCRPFPKEQSAYADHICAVFQSDLIVVRHAGGQILDVKVCLLFGF